MTKLRIARGLALDADYVGGGTFALLAKKGAGKTYTGRVMAEEMWDAKIPFVVLDPMGAWWGLRSSADGNSEGLPVAIFGGDHGDAPLERTGGKPMADLVVEEGLSMILDMQAFGTRAAERQFALDFLERLYRTNRDLVHLFIDEADLFAPQKPQAGDQPLLGVTENIVRRGRNKGIGITLITQRSAVLNKDVLTQVDGLVVLRMLSPQDRGAIDDWVRDHGDMEVARGISATLPELQNGESWWWVPELDVLEQVKVRQAHTFDSSPTKKRGERRREPRSYADVDMDAIETKMASTIERAKAEDPKELRKQLAELKRELAKLPTETKVETVTEKVEVPVLANGVVDRLEGVAAAIAETAKHLAGVSQEIRGELARVSKKPAGIPPASRQAAAAPRQPPPRKATPAARVDHQDAGGIPGDFRPSSSQQRILDALAALEAIGVPQPNKTQLALFAKASPTSGGYFNNLGTLRTAGLIDYPIGGHAALTDEGRALASSAGAPGTTEELWEFVRALVGPAKAKIVDALIDVYPEALHKDELAERIEVSPTSGGYFNNLGALRSLGLIDYPSPGYAAATPVLFLEGVPA